MELPAAGDAPGVGGVGVLDAQRDVALEFLLETLLSPGDVVAVESPTYDRALLQLTLHGMDVLPIPMDDDGLIVDALAEDCVAGRVP